MDTGINKILKSFLCLFLVLCFFHSFSIAAFAKYVYYRGYEYKSVYFGTVFRVPDSWETSEFSSGGHSWISFTYVGEEKNQFKTFYKCYNSREEMNSREGQTFPEFEQWDEKIINERIAYYKKANSPLFVDGVPYNVFCYLIEECGIIHAFFVEENTENKLLSQVENLIGSADFTEIHINKDTAGTNYVKSNVSWKITTVIGGAMALVIITIIILIIKKRRMKLQKPKYPKYKLIVKGNDNETRKT